MTIQTVKCKYCDGLFKPKVFWQRFCCPEHRVEFWARVQKDKYETNRRLEEIEKRLGIDK